jgi:hypothetical protein
MSACITGRPCALGCSLFCALEPPDVAPAPRRVRGVCLIAAVPLALGLALGLPGTALAAPEGWDRVGTSCPLPTDEASGPVDMPAPCEPATARPAALALGDPLADCLALWGEQDCREEYGRLGPVPTEGELRPKPAPPCPESRQPCGFVDENGQRWT